MLRPTCTVVALPVENVWGGGCRGCHASSCLLRRHTGHAGPRRDHHHRGGWQQCGGDLRLLLAACRCTHSQRSQPAFCPVAAYPPAWRHARRCCQAGPNCTHLRTDQAGGRVHAQAQRPLPPPPKKRQVHGVPSASTKARSAAQHSDGRQGRMHEPSIHPSIAARGAHLSCGTAHEVAQGWVRPA